MSEVRNSSNPVVVVRDVCKEFHREQILIPVLSGINLELYAGDYLALMGPSGRWPSLSISKRPIHNRRSSHANPRDVRGFASWRRLSCPIFSH